MTDFRTLLVGAGLDPRNVALCLHRPQRADRAAIALMAEAEPALFAAYQATHSANSEATLLARAHMASFLKRGDSELVFLGLFRQAGHVVRRGTEYAADPDFSLMWQRRGTRSIDEWIARYDGRAHVDLRPMEELSDLSGRLVVQDPGARALMRLAERTDLTILEIGRTADLAPPMPDWRSLEIDWQTLRAMPRTWAERLRNWRGIYLITDDGDGERYVGAAYGAENLLGRWQAHVARDVGVTAKLALRDPQQFRFTILELLSPAAGPEDVTAIEQSWMLRLGTRRFGLNA